MARCAIKGCANSKETTPRKYFFNSPEDHTFRGFWMEATMRKFSQNAQFFVCEEHFSPSKDVDIVQTFRQKRSVLKSNVYPTLNLWRNHPFTEELKDGQYTWNGIRRRLAQYNVNIQFTHNGEVIPNDDDEVVPYGEGRSDNPDDYSLIPEMSHRPQIVEIKMASKQN